MLSVAPKAPVVNSAAVGASVVNQNQPKIDLNKPPALQSMENTFRMERDQLSKNQQQRRQQMREHLKKRGQTGSLLPTASPSNDNAMTKFKQNVTGG